jgi:hypothetical protein
MTFLRSFFHRNPEKRAWRVVGMFLFLTMLMVGISPTGNYWMSIRPSSDAVCSFGHHVEQGNIMDTELILTNGTILTNGLALFNGTKLIDGTSLVSFDWYTSTNLSPLLGHNIYAREGELYVYTNQQFLHTWGVLFGQSFFIVEAPTIVNQHDGKIYVEALSGDSDSSAIVSVVILAFSFGVRLVKLHQRSSEWLNFKVRARISSWTTYRLNQLRVWSFPNHDQNLVPLKRTLIYRPLLVSFILLRMSLDIYSSLFAEVIVNHQYGFVRNSRQHRSTGF